MAELPMKINVNSFLADTLPLSTDEIGRYFMMLIEGWQRPSRIMPSARELSSVHLSKIHCARHVRYDLHPSNWPEGPWEVVREAVMLRDGEVCAYCGTEDGPFDIDHIFPKSRGGKNTSSNLTVACSSCNRSKGARTPEEWRGAR
ncbi:hypothetical protein ACVITL_002833 [Rhizobium pisi]